MDREAAARHRILVVEDDGDLRRGMRAILTIAGFEVLEAANGAEGMEAFLRCPPDCLLTDTLMPRLDGISMLEKLRDSGRSLPPVILVSGSRPFPAPEDLNRLSVIQVIAKPFGFDRLLAAVHSALAKSPEDH